MPSSKDRHRLEVPTHLYEQLAHIAKIEDRTVTSVLQELLYKGLSTYQPVWIPSQHFSRLHERTQRVLALAQEEARSFNHHYIGTEHLLLGLLREQDGGAAGMLRRFGLNLEMVRLEVEHRVGRGTEPTSGELDYTPRVRRVLGLALTEVEHLGHMSVRTEHLLLGLVRDGGGIASDILETLGILGKISEYFV